MQWLTELQMPRLYCGVAQTVEQLAHCTSFCRLGEEIQSEEKIQILGGPSGRHPLPRNQGPCPRGLDLSKLQANAVASSQNEARRARVRDDIQQVVATGRSKPIGTPVQNDLL